MKILLAFSVAALCLSGASGEEGDDKDVWLPLVDYIQLEFCVSSAGQPLHVGLHTGGHQEKVDVLDIRNRQIINTIALPEPGIHFSIYDCHKVALVSRTRLYVFPLLETMASLTETEILSGIDLQKETSLNRVVLGLHDVSYVFSGVDDQGPGKVRCVHTLTWDVQICDNCPCVAGESGCGQVKHREVFPHPSLQYIYTSTKKTELIRYQLDPSSCSLLDLRRLLIQPFDKLWFSADGSSIITDTGLVYSHTDWADTSSDEYHLIEGALMRKPIASIGSSNGFKGNRYWAMLLYPNYVVGVGGTFWLSEEINVFSYPYYDHIGSITYPSVRNAVGLPLARRLDYDPLHDVIYAAAEFNVLSNAVLGIAVLRMPQDPWPEPPVPNGGNLLEKVNQHGDDVWLITSVADKTSPSPYRRELWLYITLHDQPLFIYMMGKRLTILDPSTHEVMMSYTLPLPGLKMADSKDGHLIVAHDSYISAVEILSGNPDAINTFHTGLGGVTSLVAGPGRMAHIFPASPARTNWADVVCIDYITGDMRKCGCENYGGIGAMLNPTESWVLSLSSGRSPQRAYKYTTQKDSCLLRVATRSQGYYGNQAWFFLDGSRFVTDTGRVTASSDLTNKGFFEPMAHAPFSAPFRWVEHSHSNPNQTFVMDERNSYLSVYGWPWLQMIGAMEIPYPDRCIAAQPAYPPGVDQTNRPYKPLQVHVSPDGYIIYTLVQHVINGVTYFGIGFIRNAKVEKEEVLKERISHNGTGCEIVVPLFPGPKTTTTPTPAKENPNNLPPNVMASDIGVTHTLNGVIIGAAVGTAILVIVAGFVIGIAVYCSRRKSQKDNNQTQTANSPSPIQGDVTYSEPEGAMGPPPSYSGPVYFVPGPMDQVPSILFAPAMDENKLDLSHEPEKK